MVVGLVVLVVVILAVVALVAMYNGLVRLRNRVQEAWAQVDVELKRRHDLIGNLVETVKGYAAHEAGTLQAVTAARSAAMTPGQSPAQAAESEAALSQALVRLHAVSEAYPDLKANQGFLALQAELSSTEDRIASARRYYNATVRELNTKVDTIPTSFLAGPAGVSRMEYFEAEGLERQAPQVSFGGASGGAGGAAAAAVPPPATPPSVGSGPQDAPPTSPQA